MSSAFPLAYMPPVPFSNEEWELVQGAVARLSDAQRLWLSGYLAAGRMAVDSIPAPATAVVSADAETPILIAYGSETGNSKALAGRLLDLARDASIPVRMEDLARLRVRQLAKERKLIIICSTHGDGDPPETIVQFFEDLSQVVPGSLRQLQYAVLALGDSSYEKFCQTGRDIDRYLEQAGATRFAAREECDVDFALPARSWMQALVTRLAEEHATSGSLVAAVAPADEIAAPAFSKNNPCTAVVLDNICLSHPSRQEKIWHLELEVDERIELQPGDAVGILPHNSAELVGAIIAGAGLDPDFIVHSNGSEKNLFTALQEDCDLVLPGKALLEKWPQWMVNPGLVLELQDILSGDVTAVRQYLKTVQVRDLLQKFPVRPDAAGFIAHLRPLQPRLYDLANYHDGNAGEVHLLFKQYRYWFGERIETGVASEYLAQLAPGAKLRVYPHHSHRFRLRDNDETPLILIAEGTGIAPYRAFIEKLRAGQKRRQCWVVFLEMHYEQDFLYQSEWQQAVGEGLVTWFDGVFVSDEPNKSLQQSVLREGERFLALMQQGAEVYLCGDKKTLAACEQALADFYDVRIAAISGGNTVTDWKSLAKTGRVHRNLY